MPKLKKSQQQLRSGSLSTADGNSAFSTAQSRPARNIMHDALTDNMHETHASHARPILEQESSFGTFGGRGGLDIYATDARTADLAYQEQETASGFKGTSTPSSHRHSRSAVGGGNSMFSSFFCSMFVCCRAPDWDDAMRAESPDQRIPRHSFTHHSVPERSGSAPPGNSPRQSQQCFRRTGVSPGSPLSQGESHSDSERSLVDGPAAQLVTGGSRSSTRQSAHSMNQRPDSVATVVGPSTPTVGGLSPNHNVSTGAPGTPRSMKQTAAVEESPPELTNRGYQNRSGGPKPKSIRSRSHSRKASLSLPEIPPLVGASASTDRLSVGLTGLTAADSCLGVNQQYLNTNPQLSNLHDSSNFHGATADRLIGHLSDAASVPMSTKGAVRGEVQVGGSQKAPADFSSVYFFSPGLMTDSEVGESHAFGMVGASSRMDAVLSSTPGDGISVKHPKTSPSGEESAPAGDGSAPGSEVSSTNLRHKFLKSKAVKDFSNSHHQRQMSTPIMGELGPSHSSSHDRGHLATAPAGAAHSALQSAETCSKGSGRQNSHSSRLNAPLSQTGSGMKPIDSQLAQTDTFLSAEGAQAGSLVPFRGMDGTADYVAEYAAKYGGAGDSTRVYGESMVDSSAMHDAREVQEIDSSAMHEMHEEKGPELEDSDDSMMRKPQGMDPADALDLMLDRLCEKLDGISHRGEKILGRYILDGADGRRQGGQAVVQFARSTRDGYPYAIKFYVSRTAFEAEKKLYRHQILSPLLPHMAESSEGGQVAGGTGPFRTREKLPPFIVVEKGEALDEFVQRAQPDMYQSVAILANISKRLVHLHGAGYVHRDLKPSNFLWLPRQNRWTIIDFGSVARAGESADMSFSLRYAAPEVVEAVHRGERKIFPETSQDVWSLGVTAFELLTGVPAFELSTDSTQEVLQQLIGDEELPWEGERAITGAKYMRKLRALRGPVLKLLNRSTLRRPTMAQFCSMCDSIFSTRTDIQTPRDHAAADSTPAQPPAATLPQAATKRGSRRSAGAAAAVVAAADAAAPTAAAAASSGSARMRGRSGRRGGSNSKAGSAAASGDMHSGEVKQPRRQARVEDIYASADERGNDLERELARVATGAVVRCGSEQRPGLEKNHDRGSMPLLQLQEMQKGRRGAPQWPPPETSQILPDSSRISDVTPYDYDGDVELSEATQSTHITPQHSAQRPSARKTPKKQSVSPYRLNSGSRKSATPKQSRMHPQHAELSPSVPTRSPQSSKKLALGTARSRDPSDDFTGQQTQHSEQSSTGFRSSQSRSLRMLRDGVPEAAHARDVPEDSSSCVQMEPVTGGGNIGSEYSGISKAHVSLDVRSNRHSTGQSDHSTLNRVPSNSNRPGSSSKVRSISSTPPVATRQDSSSPSRHAFARNASNASTSVHTAAGAEHSRHSSCTDTEPRVQSQMLRMHSMQTRGESTREDVKQPLSPTTKYSAHSTHSSSDPQRVAGAVRATLANNSFQSQPSAGSQSMRSTARGIDMDIVHGAFPDDFSALAETPIGEQSSNPILSHASQGDRDLSPWSNVMCDEPPNTHDTSNLARSVRTRRRELSAAAANATEGGRSSHSLSSSLRSTGKLSLQDLLQQHPLQPQHTQPVQRQLSGRSTNSTILDEMFHLPQTSSNPSRHSSKSNNNNTNNSNTYSQTPAPQSGSSTKRVHAQGRGNSVHRDKHAQNANPPSSPHFSSSNWPTAALPKSPTMQYHHQAVTPTTPKSPHAVKSERISSAEPHSLQVEDLTAHPTTPTSAKSGRYAARAPSARNSKSQNSRSARVASGNQKSPRCTAQHPSPRDVGGNSAASTAMLAAAAAEGLCSPYSAANQLSQESDSSMLAAAIEAMHGGNASDALQPRSTGRRSKNVSTAKSRTPKTEKVLQPSRQSSMGQEGSARISSGLVTGVHSTMHGEHSSQFETASSFHACKALPAGTQAGASDTSQPHMHARSKSRSKSKQQQYEQQHMHGGSSGVGGAVQSLNVNNLISRLEGSGSSMHAPHASRGSKHNHVVHAPYAEPGLSPQSGRKTPRGAGSAKRETGMCAETDQNVRVSQVAKNHDKWLENSVPAWMKSLDNGPPMHALHADMQLSRDLGGEADESSMM